MSACGSAAHLATKLVIGSTLTSCSMLFHQLAGIGHDPGDSRRDSRDGRGQERSPTFALPSLEITIAGADGILARLQPVTVHRDTIAASGLAPLGTGLAEDLVQPFFLGLPL